MLARSFRLCPRWQKTHGERTDRYLPDVISSKVNVHGSAARGTRISSRTTSFVAILRVRSAPSATAGTSDQRISSRVLQPIRSNARPEPLGTEILYFMWTEAIYRGVSKANSSVGFPAN